MDGKVNVRERVALQLGELLLANIEQAARIEAMAEQLRAAEQPKQPAPAAMPGGIQSVDLSTPG